MLHTINKKEFKLSSKIIKLLPAFFRKQKLRSLLESVTVEELLTHSSGLIAWYPFYAQKDKDFFDILGNILNEELPKDTDRKSTRLNSSHVANSYAVFCLKKKNKDKNITSK